MSGGGKVKTENEQLNETLKLEPEHAISTLAVSGSKTAKIDITGPTVAYTNAYFQSEVADTRSLLQPSIEQSPSAGSNTNEEAALAIVTDEPYPDQSTNDSSDKDEAELTVASGPTVCHPSLALMARHLQSSLLFSSAPTATSAAVVPQLSAKYAAAQREHVFAGAMTVPPMVVQSQSRVFPSLSSATQACFDMTPGLNNFHSTWDPTLCVYTAQRSTSTRPMSNRRRRDKTFDNVTILCEDGVERKWWECLRARYGGKREWLPWLPDEDDEAASIPPSKDNLDLTSTSNKRTRRKRARETTEDKVTNERQRVRIRS
jgi:hypothetical protein